jgi:cardiolipin synthase
MGAIRPLRAVPRFGMAEAPNPADAPKVVNAGRVYRPPVVDAFVYHQPGQATELTVVQSLLGGGQIFNKVDQLLSNAKRSVVIDLFNFQSPALYPERSSPEGTPGADIQAGLVDRLIALKQRGVDVKVILDHHWDPGMEEGYNGRTIAALREHGVDVVTYPNFSTISHVKVLLVDEQYAVLGGMNWGNHSPINHDAAVYLAGPDVRNIYNEVFKPDWVSCNRKPDELADVKPFAPGRVRVLQTTARQSSAGAKDEIFREILSQTKQAQSSIYAELFVLTQPEVVDELLAAHQRLKAAGKEGVKLLVDPGIFFAFPGCRSQVQRLAKADVPIRFLKTRREIEEKLHAKWAVFDEQRLLIGSANWSNAGLLCNREKEVAATPPTDPDEKGNPTRLSRSNHEVALLIESPRLGNNFVQQFRGDWWQTFPVLAKNEEGQWKVLKSLLPFRAPDPKPDVPSTEIPPSAQERSQVEAQSQHNASESVSLKGNSIETETPKLRFAAWG